MIQIFLDMNNMVPSPIVDQFQTMSSVSNATMSPFLDTSRDEIDAVMLQVNW